jgi:hypothetical protein
MLRYSNCGEPPQGALPEEYDDVDADEEDWWASDEEEEEEEGPAAAAVAEGSHFPEPWTAEVVRENPYASRPALGRRCRGCGSRGHSLRASDGVVLCPQADWFGRGERVCRYELCTAPELHRTAVCEDLHSLCGSCLHRGHGPDANCQGWTNRDWVRARRLFKRVARLGVLTRRCTRDERWSFYGSRRGGGMPYPRSFRSLMELPVERADQVLREDQRQGASVSVPAP